MCELENHWREFWSMDREKYNKKTENKEYKKNKSKDSFKGIYIITRRDNSLYNDIDTGEQKDC